MRRDAGFSLVEVMTAMFIAALAAAAVVAALPPPIPDEEQAARRLAAALTRAQHAAVVEGAPIGVILAPDAVRFAVWDEGRWRVLDRASGFGAQDLPRGALLSLQSETVSGGAPPRDLPALVFDATGGVAPFRIRLDTADGHAVVASDDDGRVTVEASDA